VRAWKKLGAGWQPCETLPLADRGFRYGMSVFETIAIVEGRPLLLESHLERIDRSTQPLHQEGPACQGRNDIRKHLDPASKNSPPQRDSWNSVKFPPFDFSKLPTGLLRFYLTAGEGTPDAPFAAHAYALFEEAEVGWNLPPVRVESSAAPYLPRPGGWKTGNYWQNIDALAAARRAGCDEALLFNPAGMLVGAAMANVFLQIDGRWITPALETGARDGAVRAWVLRSLGADEEILAPESLRGATAAFLTNSRIGVRPVAVMDGRPLVDASQEIQRRYFDEVYSR
jgi:branched-subunit amino acid aminotransferase/4-amino-4-deoxychorismate lyase